MTIKKIAAALFLLFFMSRSFAQTQELEASLGEMKLNFGIDTSGTPYYQLAFRGKEVIKKSALGIAFADSDGFKTNLEVIGSEKKNVDDTWKPVWGEVSSIRNHYQELTIKLRQKTDQHRLMNIIFRVFEDGAAFRYEFPQQNDLKYFIVTDELTQFALTGDHKTFWIPGDYDTNEYKYSTTKLSGIDAWTVEKAATDIAVRVVPDEFAVQTPLMMKTADGLYINIHEAALINYPAMQLHIDKENFTLSSNLVPDAVGNKAYLHAPCHTPWRTMIISDDAKNILSSKMILNLNEPSKIEDTSWIKPMKFVGVWWEMQTGKSTWSYAESMDAVDAAGNLIPSGKHGATTANVKKYIDFAATNHIDGVLVEGWNIGWEDWFGNWKEEVFDFTKPYPDFDVEEITSYAESKGVKMIMHNETSGSATDYERQLDTAYKFMNKFGYTAVKTGYVGKIIPRGEHHDGQWMVNHYERVAQKAAQHHVEIDMHEAVRPTGLQRTYPNWMASEAGRGNEYNAFSDGNPPEHETILPFTRLMGGPMDYTPGIFKLKGYAEADKNRQVHTTLAKQLALYVTLYSPIQMVADMIDNYKPNMDAFQFIRDVPVDWDDTKIVEAEPGDYLTIAREGKGTPNWFIGAITDENARTATIPLNFLNPSKKYIATVYGDAKDADWKTNPEAYEINKYRVDAKTVLKLKLANGGGAAVSLKPATGNDERFKKI